MRTTRLYTDQSLEAGAKVVLQGNAAQHLGRVLRARVGEAVALFNGDGREFAATITASSKREVQLTLGEASLPATESAVHTLLGLCLSKGDRFDWAVQKATELGVGSIVPLYSERVDFSIPEDRLSKRIHHWQHVAISAAEQCGRVKIPPVIAPIPLMDWVAGVSADERWVLHCASRTQMKPEYVDCDRSGCAASVPLAPVRAARTWRRFAGSCGATSKSTESESIRNFLTLYRVHMILFFERSAYDTF